MAKYTDADRAAAKLLVATGYTHQEAAKHLGIPLSTVSMWAAQGEWSLMKKETPSLANRAAESVAAELVMNRQQYTSAWGKTAKRLADHAETAAPEEVLAQAKNYASIHGIVRDVFELGQPETVLNLGIMGDSLPFADAQVIDNDPSPNGS